MSKKLRSLLVLALVLVFSSAVFVACKNNDTSVGEGETGEIASGFVTTDGTNFMLDGEVFRFAGTNNYYLNYKDDAMIDDVIMNAKDMGLKVIRMWGFLDGVEDSMKNNNAYMQTEPGVFDQIPDGARNGFEAIDYAIKRAGEEDIKLVIAFTNNWSAFGGMDQYVAWSETAESHDDFYTDQACKDMYKVAVENLITRVNPLTGIAYMDDPAIFAWELANEPRCELDPSGDTIYNWAAEMSAYVKSLDANHMVTLGDEGFFNRPEDPVWAYNGFSGVDWERNLTIDTIDYGTFHLYPEHWGDDFDPASEAGIDWINAHQTAAESIGKPAVLEEYGIQAMGQYNRDMIYELWTNAAYESGLAGTMFWILTGIDTGDSADADGLYTDYDGFRVVNDGGSTASLLARHASEMNGETVAKEAATFITAPYDGEKISEVYAFKTSTISYDKEIEKIELEIEGVDEVIPCSIKGSVVLETYNYPLDGDTDFTFTVTFTDGTVVSDTVTAFVNNREMVEMVSRAFTFDNDMEGFAQEATCQASFGDAGVAHSTDVGDGAIMVDAVYEGQFDWQELRIVNVGVPEIAEAIRLEFDVYYLKEASKQDGIVTPYAVGNPGWVKLGLFENEVNLADLPVEEIGGKAYAVQHVVIDVTGAAGCSEVYLGLNGGLDQIYEGPIYVDNLVLITEDYAE